MDENIFNILFNGEPLNEILFSKDFLVACLGKIAKFLSFEMFFGSRRVVLASSPNTGGDFGCFGPA